jgi:stage II sporulation protein R
MQITDNYAHSFNPWELALLLALSIALCLGTWAEGRQSDLSSQLLRFHVIAVSNDDAEQALKLRVRDAVLEYISPALLDVHDVDTAKAIVTSHLPGIQQAAEAAAEGRAVTVTLSSERYPTKHYEGFTLPAGKYDSLRIVLGEGQGQNWWCIVFPQICLSAAQSAAVEQELDEDSFRLISDSENYSLKFRTLELWGELCNRLDLYYNILIYTLGG